MEKENIDKQDSDHILELMSGKTFNWFYNDEILEGTPAGKSVNNDFMFTHMFHNWQDGVCSDYFDDLLPLLNTINPKIILRVKANLRPYGKTIHESLYHVDYEQCESLKNVKTAIYYVNTCNGYTKFEDGTKEYSEKGKVIMFDQGIKHAGTNTTNEKRRMVININYI